MYFLSLCYPVNLPLYSLPQGKSAALVIKNQLKIHYILEGGWGGIAILIMSGQIAISLCSLRTHLLKEMAQMKQSECGNID